MRAGWCLVVWTAALQCAAAERLRLIDDFETIEWPRVDAGEFWGLGAENQPLTGSLVLF